MSDFRKYDHLQRMGHRNTRGLEEGKVYVFPKLDGTNASVWAEIPMDPLNPTLVRGGSRNRQLAPGEDNAGFLGWLLGDSAEALDMRTVALENTHLIFYGEWLVPHTLKTYEMAAWRQFYVFDVWDREEGRYLPFEDYRDLLKPTSIPTIHPLRIIENPSGAQLKAITEENDFLIKEGEGLGEGVVCKNYDWRTPKSGRVWGKFVRSEFKAGHRATMGVSTEQGHGNREVERQIAEQFVTKTLVDKTLAKVLIDVVNDVTVEGVHSAMSDFERFMFANYRNRIIPQLLGRVWHDLIDEEMFAILKKHKGATIDFRRLQARTTTIIKSLVPELF